MPRMIAKTHAELKLLLTAVANHEKFEFSEFIELQNLLYETVETFNRLGLITGVREKALDTLVNQCSKED